MAAILLLLSYAALTSGYLWDESPVVDLAECHGEDKLPCLSGGCVPLDKHCNGVRDCADGSDEEFCPHRGNETCDLPNQYHCADHKRCVPYDWLCNNRSDCDDGSDEANCAEAAAPAANATCKGFVCDGNKCISRLWVHDGYYDCQDKTDEISEDTSRHELPTHLRDIALCLPRSLDLKEPFRCLDASFCLPQDMVCDGMADCRDGTDEGDFCEHWHTICSTKPCKANDTVCYPLRSGFDCSCIQAPSLLKYNHFSGRCQDIDECALARPQCSHMCQNHDGHYTCTCDEGYRLDKFKYLCYADEPEAMLFFTTKNEIRYVTVTSKKESVVATGVKDAHGVSYDGKYLYWVETALGHQAIMRAQFMDVQNTKEVLVSLGLEDPGDIAVDWVGGHIYFSDVHRGAISVCRSDGSVCATLDTRAKQPRFVTLDVRHGQMYWADWHSHKPVLMSARMDGSAASELPVTLRTFATGLAVDAPNQRLYFVDHLIRVYKIDDHQTYTLFEDAHHHPYSIAVFENTVFWSDWTTNTIQTTDKLHGPTHNRNELISKDSPVYDMHVYHPVLLGRHQNPCEAKNCSHLCLKTSNTTAACVCPEGMVLKYDSTCEHMEGYRPLYLVVGGGSSFTRLDYRGLGNPETHATHFDIGRVQAMAYDNTRDTLYVYDGQRKDISYINMSDFSLGVMRLLVYRGLENVVDMDYDYASDSLYILDAGRRFVEVVSLRSQQRALVTRFRDDEKPVSFCVLPDYGRMLVALLQTELGHIVHVVSIGLNGEDRQNVVMTDLQGPKVVLRYYHEMDVVFLADEGNSIIDAMHPEGTARENFRQVPRTVTSLAVTDPYVFWTDRRTKLYWSNAHEASHHIRRIEFSMFPQKSLLHIQPTSPPPDPKSPLLSHPCLTAHPCSHVCVQTPHAPPSTHSKTRAKTSNNFSFKCLCPPSLLNLDGNCESLVQCKDKELYCHMSNVCILEGKRCDGIKDCSHGEDEEYCEEITHETEQTKACSTGYKLCDDVCVEDSHSCGEHVGTSSNVPESSKCLTNEFQCVNSSICIERSQMCDGRPDCFDASDEATSLCSLLACHPHEFMCTLGSCILTEFRCDGENDCADGSDEVDCVNKTCVIGFYQCRSGECLEMHKRCDGHHDCADSSDEEHCGEPELEEPEPVDACAEGEFSCSNNRSICLPASARCNTKSDCPSGSDEWGCDFFCSPHTFACKQQLVCLGLSQVCNERKDCLDGSDETPEACRLVNKTSVLYPPLLLPASECRDGFLCGNGQCLEWRQVCDRSVDCFDATDEDGQCDTSCANHTCPYTCQPTPRGAHCSCGDGWRMRGARCEDVDECAAGACAQLCTNHPGSFRCQCFHGYALRPDHLSCKAASGPPSVLYVSGNAVWGVAEGNVDMRYHNDQNGAIAGFDVDVRQNKLYVSLAATGHLVQVNSSKGNVVVSNVGHPTKVAVDWLTGNVYFVDSTPAASCIRVCNVKKRRCAKLQKLPIDAKVTSLVVDPPSGRMFYCTVRARDSTVWSASLAGYDQLDLATAGQCSGLAVDSFRRLLYVAEADPPRVFRIDFNGEREETIVDQRTDGLAPLQGLAFFEDSIFFISKDSSSMTRCTLFGTRRCDRFAYKVTGAESFLLQHDSFQRGDVSDECARAAACPHLCAAGVCLCGDGAPPQGGVCREVEQDQLPLFDGWTQQQHQTATQASLTAIGALLLACAVYLAVFLYYHFVITPRRRRNYMEVHFRNANEQTADATTTVVPVPEAPTTAHEFVNPLEYVRDIWDQVRRQNRPVGTAGLEIDVPYVQQDLSDTESDLDEREHKNIVRK